MRGFIIPGEDDVGDVLATHEPGDGSGAIARTRPYPLGFLREKEAKILHVFEAA